MRHFLPLSTLLLACLLTYPLQAKVLHKERSLYSTIVVSQSGNILCLQFSVRRDQRNQSCKDLNKPKRMVFAYTRMTMASLLFTPEPSRVLVVGLGGGTLPEAFSQLFPDVEIDVLEIDPAVTRVAKDFFDYQPTPTTRVFGQDARVWTKRAQRKGEKYDLIILAAFNGEYIPEHLMTREYLEETKALLAPEGTLVANTFSISSLYGHESATYQAVFGGFINFQVPESANRVVIVPGTQVDDATLRSRAEALRTKLKPYDVPLKRYTRTIIDARNKGPDWDANARVLTDQYAPANLLNQ